MRPSRRVVEPQLQPAEGGLKRGIVPPAPRPAEGSAEGASSEAKFVCFLRVGLLPSSEAEMERAAGEPQARWRLLLRVYEGASDGPYIGVGPWTKGCFGPLWNLERIWALRKSWRCSTVSGCRVTMELSSLVALLTISRLGDFFLSRIAVE